MSSFHQPGGYQVTRTLRSSGHCLEGLRILSGCGLELTEKETFIDRRRRIKFRELSNAEKAAVIAEDPLYGRVICRCEP